MLPADFAFLLFYNSELLRNHAILKMQDSILLDYLINLPHPPSKLY